MANLEATGYVGEKVLELLSANSDVDDVQESEPEPEDPHMYYSDAGSHEEASGHYDDCRALPVHQEGIVDHGAPCGPDVPGPSKMPGANGMGDQAIAQSCLGKTYDNRWMQNLHEFLSRPTSADPIAGQSCPPAKRKKRMKTKHVPPPTKPKDFMTPLDVVKLFLDDATLEGIVKETNRYAAQVLETEVSSGKVLPFSAARKWTKLSMEEFYNFLAITLHMAVVSKSELSGYWSTDPVMYSAFTCKLMARDRFRNILTFLHLSDNATYKEVGMIGHDPAFKIRPLFDSLAKKFEQRYVPSECNDGSVLCWRGRFHSKVYSKEKPPKPGVKLFELSDMETRYVWRLELAIGGKEMTSKPQDVLTRLSQPLLADGYAIYMDTYNIYPPIVNDIGVHFATVVVESVKTGSPPSATSGQSKESNKRQPVIALKCRSNQVAHANPVLEEIARDKRRRLALGSLLNQSSDPDRDTQLLSSVVIVRKSLKWWKRLFFHLFSIVMVNAQVLYNKEATAKGQQKMALRKFYCEVAKAFAGAGTAAAHPARDTRSASQSERLTGRHFPCYLPMKPGHAKRPTRVCKVCSARARRNANQTEGQKKMRKESSYMCKECNVSLCVTPCFAIWHTEEEI